jgi:hypothetical protein
MIQHHHSPVESLYQYPTRRYEDLKAGISGQPRWRKVLSAAELELYEAAAGRELTPECRRWLEDGGTV